MNTVKMIRDNCPAMYLQRGSIAGRDEQRLPKATSTLTILHKIALGNLTKKLGGCRNEGRLFKHSTGGRLTLSVQISSVQINIETQNTFSQARAPRCV